MSEVSTRDLSGLARPSEETAPPSRRMRVAAYSVVLLLLAGIAGLLTGDLLAFFEEATPVRVVRPVSAGAVQSSEREVVLQAAGWVEPDPFPVAVAALTDGVIKRFLVEEGDAVAAEQPLAELVPDDAVLDRRAKEAELARLKNERSRAKLIAGNAAASFEAALAVTESVERARAARKAAQAALETARREREAVAATSAVAEHELRTQIHLRENGAVGPWQVEIARAKRDEVEARQRAKEAAIARAEANLADAEAALRRAEGDLRLRLEDRLLRDRTRAEVEVLDARIAEAEVALEKARLREQRQIVRAPAAGVVLRRDGHPGLVVGPQAGAPVLCTLYEPDQLRVRVDVPLPSVANARVGQRAEIRSETRRDAPYAGEVLRIIDRADIQKVTLEVQVRVEDPDELLRPEMLCQVSFFGTGEAAEAGASTEVLSLPTEALVGDDACWVLDVRESRARLRRLQIIGRERGRVLVRGGVNPTDKVLISRGAPLREGMRVDASREDRP